MNSFIPKFLFTFNFPAAWRLLGILGGVLLLGAHDFRASAIVGLATVITARLADLGKGDSP